MQDAGRVTDRDASTRGGEPSVPFPPPPWPLGVESRLPATTRTPRLRQIALTVVAIPCWALAMFGLLAAAAEPVDAAAAPRWAHPMILMALLAVGAVLLSAAWANKVVVDHDAIHVRVIGLRKVVDLRSASRIRVTPVATPAASDGVMPGGTVRVEITGALRPHHARAELSETDALCEAMVRWWYARPDLVQDQETARALASVAARLAGRL